MSEGVNEIARYVSGDIAFSAGCYWHLDCLLVHRSVYAIAQS
jgi:hypothetical protein